MTVLSGECSITTIICTTLKDFQLFWLLFFFLRASITEGNVQVSWASSGLKSDLEFKFRIHMCENITLEPLLGVIREQGRPRGARSMNMVICEQGAQKIAEGSKEQQLKIVNFPDMWTIKTLEVLFPQCDEQKA